MDEAAVAAACRSIKGRTSPPTRDYLINLPAQDLVRIFEECAATSEGDARSLHEEWLYRGMKSLFLYRISGNLRSRADVLDKLNAALAETAPPRALTAALDPNRQLQFEAVDTITAGRQTIVEARYRYCADIDYIDPTDEDAKTVADLRHGFVWLSGSRAWAAIAARDLDSRDRVVAAVQRAAGVTLSALRFNKEIVSAIEPDDHRRRIALVDPQTQTVRRISGKRMGHDDEAQSEIRSRWSRDEAPWSGYTVDVDRHTEMVLGYNNTQGKIFFSKDLTADQLRRWGPAKIGTILDVVSQMLSERPAYRKQVIASSLQPLPSTARAAATELAEAVSACRTSHASEHALQLDSLELLDQLNRLVSPVLHVLRDDNEEVADVICPSCDSDKTLLSGDARAVQCGACGQSIPGNRLSVADGPDVRIAERSDIIQLLPTPRLREAVLQAATAIDGHPANVDEEYFYVRGSTLYYSSRAWNAVLTLDEIPELRALIDRNIPAARLGPATIALSEFKEKCRQISLPNCSGCVANRVGVKCYLRLFGLLDSTFVPRPHTGSEYGDYSKSVTIGGRANQSLVVVMKSAENLQGEITPASREGREILQQSIASFRNTGVAAVGVSVPRRLHGDLRQMLVDQARLHRRRVVFLDDAVLGRTVATVMRRRSLTLAQL